MLARLSAGSPSITLRKKKVPELEKDMPSLFTDPDPAKMDTLRAMWDPLGEHAFQYSFLHTRRTDCTRPQKVHQDALDGHTVSVVIALEDGQEIRILTDGEDGEPILRYVKLEKGGAWRPNLLLSPALSCAS